ncbi:hypothetical protein [Rhizobium bangladeshense]|uniref:hypothetical protein n=1 Tax=Rhizobium bangladeshense TaxID=1138189 RepID=UPI0007E574BA|nr:hypothetical protein [Rhizobium bangladeshense]
MRRKSSAARFSTLFGHETTNKTLEGYSGDRFDGGGQSVDMEQAAIDRAKQISNCNPTAMTLVSTVATRSIVKGILLPVRLPEHGLFAFSRRRRRRS